MSRFLVLSLALASLLVLGLACGGGKNNNELPTITLPSVTIPTAQIPGSNGGQGGGNQPANTHLEISAQNISFSTDRLVAPANTDISLTFDNKDAGVLHNVAIYKDKSASEAIFVGQFVTGPGSITYNFKTPGPGTYYFRCNAHPDQMNGTFVVQ